MGSSNTERQQEFTGESSDVDIISNPSQSSIEVLDQQTSRKASEERRLAQHMSPLDENYHLSYTQSFIEREFGNTARAAVLGSQIVETKQRKITTNASAKTSAHAETLTANSNTAAAQTVAPAVANSTHIQLIESSSSGSVTDSVCTAYEQQQQQQQELLQKTSSTDELLSKSAEQAILRNLLAAENFSSNSPEPIITQTKPINSSSKRQSTQATKKEESSKVSSMFGGECKCCFLNTPE